MGFLIIVVEFLTAEEILSALWVFRKPLKLTFFAHYKVAFDKKNPAQGGAEELITGWTCKNAMFGVFSPYSELTIGAGWPVNRELFTSRLTRCIRTS